MPAPPCLLGRERGSRGWRCMSLFEAEGVEGTGQFCTKSLDGQLMIGTLRQSRDGDGANDAGSCCAQREAPPMAGVVRNGQPIAVEEVGLLLLHLPPNGIGTAMKTGYHVAFTADPLHVVRGRARERTVEQRLP